MLFDTSKQNCRKCQNQKSEEEIDHRLNCLSVRFKTDSVKRDQAADTNEWVSFNHHCNYRVVQKYFFKFHEDDAYPRLPVKVRLKNEHDN